MTDLASWPSSTVVDCATPPADRSSHRRLILAALMSAMLPGAGHFLVRRWRKGLFLLLISCVWFVAYCWLRLPQTAYGAILPFLLLMGIGVLATWDVAYSGQRPETKPSQWWLATLLPAVLFGGIVHLNWVLRASGFGSFVDVSSSMAPAIPLGSHLMVDRRSYRYSRPRRGDIIVFDSSTTPGLLLMKRVIAVGGETIKVEGETVLINGQRFPEPYAVFKGSSADLPWVEPTILPADKLFVMGDNRNLSFDSRYEEFGLVDVHAVRGKVIYMFPPMSSDLKRFD